MALLRILIIFFSFIPLQTFADGASGGGFCAETSAENSTYQEQSKVGSSKILNVARSIQNIDGGLTLKAAEELDSQLHTCGQKKSFADWACIETCSSSIKSFSDEWGGAVNLAAMAGNSGLIGSQCSAIARALSKAQQVLTLYQAACGTGKAVCTASCIKIEPMSKKVSEASMDAVNKAQDTQKAACALSPESPTCADAKMDFEAAVEGRKIIAEALGKTTTAGKSALAKCNTYEKMKSGAMAGALMALQGMMTAKSCEKQNTNEPTPGMDCNDAQSPGYATINCQCARGEKSPAECQNINVNAATIQPGSISLPNVSSTTGSGGGGSGGADFTDDPLALKPSAATPGGAPPPVDGGGGGLDGGGGGNGGGAQDGANYPRRLNANILGGYGSGGGGGSGGAGPGYDDMDSKLKDYMPGAKKDPNRSLASQLAKEVTPQAGRSNWEKVRLRYRDNYRSLLNK